MAAKFTINDKEKIKSNAHRFAQAGEMRNYADSDYIAARTLHRNSCFRQFLFLATASLEKYLKSILLYQNIAQKKATHSIMDLLNKCENEMRNFGISSNSKDFVVKMDDFHRIRYPDCPFIAEYNFILFLDEAIWELRFFAQNPQMIRNITQKSIETMRKYRGKNKGNGIIKGYLEKVLRNNNKRHTKERDNLVWNNLYYGDRRKSSVSVKVVVGHEWRRNFLYAGDEIWQLEAYEAVEGLVYFSQETKRYFEKIRNEVLRK